jgi:hypothetical protein
VAGVYEKSIDRESAYEKLKGRAAAAPVGTSASRFPSAPVATDPTPSPRSLPGAAPVPSNAAGGGLMGGLNDVLFGTTGPRGAHHEGLAESAARSAMRSIGSAAGREIIRGVLGGLFGGRR